MATNYNEFITALSNITGLNKDVVAAWVKREQGAYNNPLGLTYTSTSSGVPVGKWIASNRYLGAFPSQTAAAQATAQRLNQAQYAGIRNAARTGTSEQQALAIAKSPWRLGQSGLQSLWRNPEPWMSRYPTGTDPYYYKGFVEAGILGYVTNPQGGASTPITPTPSQTPPANQGSATTLDKLLGIPDMPINDETIGTIRATITALVNSGKLTAEQGKNLNIVLDDVGTFNAGRLSDIDVDTVTGDFHTISTNPTDLVPDVTGAIFFIGVILVGITFMILGGFITLRTRK